MTPHTLNGFSVLIPDIPEGATEMRILGKTLEGYKPTGAIYFYRDLPPGDWQLLKLSEVSEEMAGEMVEFINRVCRGYKDYETDGWMCHTAHASLTSWVRAQGVEGDPYLLIKKND